jgi:peptidoglycan/LPS O-acetylase OafA/YrhL
MTTIANQEKDRQYYIDWLRILLIISVFLFHTGMIFNTWDWHIKNDILYGGALRRIMSFLHNWRMPLLFMLSGAGTFFALGRRRPGQYLLERTMRLLIPLIAGIFILVPVQVYIEKIDDYSSLAAYYPHMFEGIYPEGNFSWHHLWFIAYLFVIALIVSPFLNLLRSDRFRVLVVRAEGTLTKPFGLNLIIIPLLLSQIILRPFFETETNALVNDWASITYYIIFFLAGFILLPFKSISEAIGSNRRLYLAETAVITLVMYTVLSLLESERTAEIIYDVLAIAMSWTCSLAAIGYAKKYLSMNSPLRKHANEAIYPFYLLHQPALVITGYLVVSLDFPVLFKVLIIMTSSITLILSIYWFVIRPVNVLRIMFGMKPLPKREQIRLVSLSGSEQLCDAERA